LIETHFNIQRRLYDYQFSLSRTPIEFEQAHRRFLALYNSTAHYGLLQEQFASPIPLEGLGEAKGRLYTLEELDRKFSRALFPRTTNSVWLRDVTQLSLLRRGRLAQDTGLAVGVG
jgi:hypothetical protein